MSKEHEHKEESQKVFSKQNLINWSIIACILIVLIAISANLRLQTASLNGFDDRAEQMIVNGLQSQIRAQVDAQNPFMPQAQKEVLVQSQTREFLSQNQAEFQAQKQAIANQLKTQFQHDDGQTYLLELDPYFYYRFTQNTLTNGHMGEYKTEDGVPASKLTLAPRESLYPKTDLHVSFAVFWHKLVNVFKSTPLHTTFFFIPVIIMGLAVIPAFFIGRKLGGNLGGIIAALLISLNPILLHRTMAGFSDTDGYNILFFLLAIWFFIEAIDAKSTKARVIHTILIALSLALYAWAWEGWYVSAILIVGALVATIIVAALKDAFLHKWNFKALKKDEHFLHTFKSRSIIFLTLIVSIPLAFILVGKGFGGIIQGLFTALTKREAIQAAVNIENLWPNILTTVAELSNPPIEQIIQQSVGTGSFSSLLFIFGVLGIITLLFRNFNKKDGFKSIEFTYAILFTLWLAGTFFMSTTGTRFIMFVAPPIAILIGVNFGLIAKLTQKYGYMWFDLPKKATSIGAPIVVGLLALFFIWPAFAQADLISKNTYPMMDDQMYNLLLDINKTTDYDAIISSWWDYGHIYITISGRGATGDGTSQKAISTTWLGKALVENDPQNFVGISRMLNCDSSQTYEELEKLLGNDAIKATNVVYQTFGKTQSQAKDIYIQAGLSEADALRIAQGTHCADNPQSLWVASDDMIGKAPVWAHFGLWNFTKAKMWQMRKDEAAFVNFALTQKVVETDVQARTLRRTLLSYNEQQGNSWIADWPRYYTTDLQCRRDIGSVTINCQIMANLDQSTRLVNATFNTQTQETSFVVVQAGRAMQVAPQKVTALVDTNYITKTYDSTNMQTMDIGFSIVEQPDGSFRGILADVELIDSMFHRMYFMDAAGLDDILVKKWDVRGANGIHFKVFERTNDFE
jgi:dolichyl-phosphooligosaccharide-protein glycotransferase